MKIRSLLAVAAVLSFSTAAFAADVDFSKGIKNATGAIFELQDNNTTVTPLSQPKGFDGPGHGGDHHPGPGPGGDHHPGPGPDGDHHHPGPGPDGDHHHPGPGPEPHHKPCPPVFEPSSYDYDRDGIKPDCRVWEFTAGSANSRTEKFNMKEYGTYRSYRVTPRYDFEGCVTSYDTELLSTSPYEKEWGHSRELTVEIGERPLKPGQVENLTVCQSAETDAEVDVSKMAFEYQVLKENTSGFWKKATKFTLTPGQPKP